jgi:hypothetical protein
MQGSDDRGGAAAHPRDLIRAALRGLEEGGPQIRDGGSDSGPPLYDSAEQGWQLQMSCDFSSDPEAARRGKPLVYRFYVDHVGMGRREALPIYADALRAAGLEATIDVVGGGSSKRVVWLGGVYDGEGRRVA